ncbi:hypothetical protein SPKIRA_29760 [Sphingomonas paucimobilis]|jgi:methyl-accepting chemotaxis protein|uniref:DNA, contig: SP664 n=2 Tax=Sphingomonas paucimobilis TaxID=13689 RepID=A0A0C9NM89_SPHPI|nr:hypothetical protein BRX36_17345 [Sphingomonas sp. S-NIH.Pt1_0416]BCI72146.1 hypothetical protein SPKIRA_29760 [Sphingomonas paucimobilis]GAN15753.1 hypothetical protein SP6_64_00080 [Sphingomonas paucimobilis NBRC 13935]
MHADAVGVIMTGKAGPRLPIVMMSGGCMDRRSISRMRRMAVGPATISPKIVAHFVEEAARDGDQNAAMVEQSTAAARSLATQAQDLGMMLATFQLTAQPGDPKRGNASRDLSQRRTG